MNWGIKGCTTQPLPNTTTLQATLEADFQYAALFLTNLNEMKSPLRWMMQFQPYSIFLKLNIGMQPYEEEEKLCICLQ